MRHALTVDGPAPIGLAWERYADPGLWATWAPQIRDVEWRGADRLAPGMTGTVHAIAGFPVRFEITDVDEGAHDWAWTVHPPKVTMHLRHTLEETVRGTRAGLVIEGPFPVVIAYTPLAHIALGRLLAVDDDHG